MQTTVMGQPRAPFIPRHVEGQNFQRIHSILGMEGTLKNTEWQPAGAAMPSTMEMPLQRHVVYHAQSPVPVRAPYKW